MSGDTSYRQHRCKHGWVDVGQCKDCATAARLAEFESGVREIEMLSMVLAGDDAQRVLSKIYLVSQRLLKRPWASPNMQDPRV